MKKVLMAALLVAVFAGLAMAATSGTVNVAVVVGGVWEIELDVSAVDFGTINPGFGGTAAVTATVRTNQKAIWYLKLNKDHDLRTADLSETIPSGNFTYIGSGTGIGLWTNGEFQTLPTQAYAADATEYKNLGAGTDLITTLNLTIPNDAAAGIYSNTITYTLTATP